MKETVMIIGGAGFFGRAVMNKFIDDGYGVLIADIKEPEGHRHENTGYVYMDAGSSTSIITASHFIKQAGIQRYPHHIINLIGSREESGLTNMADTSEDEIEATLRRNFNTQLYPVKYLHTELGRQIGDKSITLMSSINAQAGYSIPFYTAVKGGVEAFVRPAAVELGPLGIRVNAVAPGSVRTPSTEKEPKDLQARAAVAPLGRLAMADDVAEAFLSVVKMKAYTGQTLAVDCGQSITPAEALYLQHRGLGAKLFKQP